MGESFTKGLIFTGRGGLFGSTPGLLVGIGFWKENKLYNHTIIDMDSVVDMYAMYNFEREIQKSDCTYR